MAFDAGKVVEALNWSWRPYVDLSGTVPEPSDDELRAMNKALRDAFFSVTGEDVDPEDRKAIATAYNRLTEEQAKAAEEANLVAIATVTKNSPTLEQLREAKPRLRREFIKWLLGELNNPEGQATATKP